MDTSLSCSPLRTANATPSRCSKCGPILTSRRARRARYAIWPQGAAQRAAPSPKGHGCRRIQGCRQYFKDGNFSFRRLPSQRKRAIFPAFAVPTEMEEDANEKNLRDFDLRAGGVWRSEIGRASCRERV